MFENVVIKKDLGDFFWEREEVLLIDFLKHGLAINYERYCKTLTKLRRGI